MKSLIGKWIEQYKEIASIKREPSLISNYEHPEEKLQLAAISRHTRCIKYIRNPSEAVQLEAVRRNPESIIWIKNPGEEVQLSCIRQAPYLIKSINNPTEKVQIEALHADPTLLPVIHQPALNSLLYVAKVSPASLSGRVYDSVTRKAILHENPHCEAFLNIATTKSYLNTIENNPDMFKRVELTSDLLKEIYVTHLSQWYKEQLVSRPNNDEKMKFFLAGRTISEELQLLIVKDNYFNYPYITHPTTKTTSYVLTAVTGNQYKGSNITCVEKPLRKLILSLHDSFLMSKLPLSNSIREQLNSMNIYLDDYEIRHNEYIQKLYENYKEFKLSTGLSYNDTAYIQQTKTFLLQNYAKDSNGDIDNLNVPKGMDMYTDCIDRGKVMKGVETAFTVDVKAKINKELESAGLSSKSLTEQEVIALINGSPIKLSNDKYLLKVKSPGGITFKIHQDIQKERLNENIL